MRLVGMIIGLGKPTIVPIFRFFLSLTPPDSHFTCGTSEAEAQLDLPNVILSSCGQTQYFFSHLH